MADRRITLADEENLFFASRLLSRGIDLVSVVQALVVAEYLSFSAAASALGVRQSGVSKRIRLLEDNLGVTLFERGPRGVRTTLAGESFLTPARGVLPQFDSALPSARQAGRGDKGIWRKAGLQSGKAV